MAMTRADLIELESKSADEIYEYLIVNPNNKNDVLNHFEYTKGGKYKNTIFVELSGIIKDKKLNPRGDAANRAKEVLASNIGFKEINIDSLVENPYQPRIEMNPESIKELAESITKNGLLEPIKVSPNKNETFTIVYGHRRVEAHKLLGKNVIKCIVEQVSNEALIRESLIENIQREDLSPIEKALSFKNAMKYEGFKTQRELSNELNINEARISEILSLLKLHEDIISDLSINKKIKDATALSLLNKVEPEKQFEIYEMLKNGEIDREGIRKYLDNKNKGKESQPKEQYETCIRSNKLKFTFKSSIINKKDLKEFNEEVKRLTDELAEKLKEKEVEYLSK